MTQKYDKSEIVKRVVAGRDFIAKAIPEQMPQTQISLNEQLDCLYSAAHRLGLYDAADWLADRLHERVPEGL